MVIVLCCIFFVFVRTKMSENVVSKASRVLENCSYWNIANFFLCQKINLARLFEDRSQFALINSFLDLFHSEIELTISHTFHCRLQCPAFQAGHFKPENSSENIFQFHDFSPVFAVIMPHRPTKNVQQLNNNNK